MKVLLTLVVLYAAVAASADDKAGHLFNAFKGKGDAPAAAHAAVVPPVAPAAPTAAAPKATAAGAAAPQVDGPAVEPVEPVEAVEPVVVIEAEAPSSPLPALLSLASAFFGANPTARDLRRPIVSAKTMEEDGAPALPEAGAGAGESLVPPRRGGGLLGAVCGGIWDALFGPPPAAPVVAAVPAPDASAVMTPGGWFNFRPSAFFESFMGPPAPLPSTVPAVPTTDGADAADGADPTLVPVGTPLVTVVRSVTTTDENGNTESEVTVLPPPPPVPSALLVPDAGMHRVGGSARAGKLFNRVMRFLNLRPRPDVAAPDAPDADGGDDDDADAPAADDAVPPATEDDDDDDSADDQQPPAEADDAEADGARDGWHTRHGGGRAHRWLRWLKRKARKAARKAADWFGRRGWGHGWRHGRWGRHHRACRHDVARLCPDAKVQGGFTAVLQCMAQHRHELSGQCLSHVQYSRAFNCADDAARLCPGARSRHALKRCLKRARDRVSEQCKAAVRAHRKWWKRAAVEDDTDADAVTAVADDGSTEAVADTSAVEYVDADVLTTDAPAPAPTPTPTFSDLLTQQQQTEQQLPAQERLVIAAANADAPLQAAPMHAVRRGPALMETKEQQSQAEAKAKAKPSVSARVSAWVSGAAASASAHAKRLPQWAVVTLAVVAALALVGAVSACVVVTCRRRAAARLAAAAAAAAAAPKQPLLSAAPGGPAVPCVQITALPARSARAAPAPSAPSPAPVSVADVTGPAPAPLTAAAAVAAVAEPAVTVTVAAV